MEIGSRDLRLILFGPQSKGSESALKEPLLSTLLTVARGRLPEFVPPEALEEGLLARVNHGLIFGPRAVCLADLSATDLLKVNRAAEQCAQLICNSLISLKAALGNSIEPFARDSELAWCHYGFMVVGGLLLDLEVGDALRQTGLVGKVASGWRIWILPQEARVPAFGVRCSHDQVSGLGAGLCWHQKLPDPGPLPTDEELRALSQSLVGKEAPSSVLLQLRFRGWLDGCEPTVPVLGEGAPIWSVLKALALQIVNAVHRPTYLCILPRTGNRNQERLSLARLMMEYALKQLEDRGVLSIAEGKTKSRWLWRGRLWSLAADTLGT